MFLKKSRPIFLIDKYAYKNFKYIYPDKKISNLDNEKKRKILTEKNIKEKFINSLSIFFLFLINKYNANKRERIKVIGENATTDDCVLLYTNNMVKTKLSLTRNFIKYYLHFIQ
jgi:hypothetical protein